MRHKFQFATVFALCLAMIVGVTPAAEREMDQTSTRSKQRMINGVNPNAGRDAVDMSQTFGDGGARAAVQREGASALRAIEKATAIIDNAQDKEGVEAINELSRALAMIPADAESDEQLDKARFSAYVQLAEAYSNPTKQASMLAMALQYTSDPVTRTRLESQIAATGGEVVDLQFTGNGDAQSGRTAGFADTCQEAAAATLGTISVSIDVEGEHDWFFIDVNTASGGGIISTFTTTDGAPLSDDTDLNLYDSCEAFDAGDPPIFANDDFGGDFTSRIDTGCLNNGTYYVEVGGWIDSTIVDSVDFTVEIEECTPPMPDQFEPDDDRENAARIGRLVSGNPFGLFKGTVKKEIQAHNFFPAPDLDFVKFLIIRNELVQMETGCGFPTVFNDFTSCEDAPGDTIMDLLSDQPENYGGLCNSTDAGAIIGDVCFTDDDCDLNDNGDPLDDLINPLPGFPPCIPAGLFTFFPVGEDPAFASDDDGGEGFASKLEICLPSGIKPFSPSAVVANSPGDELEYFWYVSVRPFFGTDTFDYEVLVRNQATCQFEQEPNNTPEDATVLNVNGRHSGFYDFSESAPSPFEITVDGLIFNPDADFYSFDVDQASRVILQTEAYNATAADTFIELIVGPDENGDFFTTGVSDEDGGDGFLSRIDVVDLPPANELLGITLDPADEAACANQPPPAPWWWPADMPWWGDLIPVPDYCGADYFVNVTANYLNPNYPYDLISTVIGDSIAETEPNDDCMTNAEAASFNDTYIAAIDESCDFDTYKFEVDKDAFVRIETFGTIDGGSTDTAIQLVDCATGTPLGCDDDGSQAGLLSRLQGCVGPGEYCVQVRAFGTGTGDYQISITGGDFCLADTPPLIDGDEAFTCSDFNTCP